ncbi:MAG: DegV family protein [Clostridiales bacterium]|jgi:DegV family protein with EDD domain|nr:DegV family protein [Clostridiales bacterium]
MIKIVVDSGCDLNPEIKQEIGANVIPLNLQIDGVDYIDDEKLDSDTYMEAMMASTNVPKTAAPSPERYLESFKAQGSVFAVTISSKLSASYNNACLAKDMFLDEAGDKFIHIIDSLTASAGESSIAIKLHELIKNNLSENEIVDKITYFVNNLRTYLILEKFDNLVKNGRMSPTIAKLASILSIKPICKAKDGQIVLHDKARGYQKAATKLINIIKNDNIDFENAVLTISHVKALQKAIDFKDQIAKVVKFKDIIISETSGLCSTYAYMGGIVVSYYN